MRGHGAVVALALLVLPSRPAAAGEGDLDGERQAWRYRRPVEVPDGTSPLAALPLAPEVAARCQGDLRDLRLLDPDGRERPFVADRVVGEAPAESWPGRLVDARREARRSSVWVMDLGEVRGFDRIELEVPGEDFAKGLRVEASDDRRSWRLLQADAGVFDRVFGARVHHTRIELPGPEAARYLRFTALDRRSPPVEIRGLTVVRVGRTRGSEWTRPVALERLAAPAGVSRYRLQVESRLPLRSFDLEADDAAFRRRVRLLEVDASGGERSLGEGWLYRLRVPGELTAEALSLAVAQGQGGSLVLEVYDGDSPPLRDLRGLARGPAARLLFPADGPGSLTLYYGNAVTRPPAYDLELLRERLGPAADVRLAELGPETANPRFQAAPPLSGVPTAGAAVDVTRWRALRTLAPPPREDVYSVGLAAADLGTLRGDLGDLRVVDASDRQVPYLLVPDTGEERVALETSREPESGPGVSRYRLRAPAGPTGEPASLALRRLELDFAEGFFDRPARVFVRAAVGSRRRGDETLFSGRLSRPAGRQDAVSLPLDGARRGELLLEIEEGDNAPLSLGSARGVVAVARVAFKAGPGPLRLLLGNPEAAAPRYDIAVLRQEVLSYSAAPLSAAGLEANSAFRRRAADYLRDAPPTALLWGALGLAVAVLLYLTARLLRPAEGEGP